MCPPLAQSFTTMLEKTFEAVPFEDFQACFGREFGEKHRDYLFDLYSDLISVTRSNSEEEFGVIVFQADLEEKLARLEELIQQQPESGGGVSLISSTPAQVTRGARMEVKQAEKAKLAEILRELDAKNDVMQPAYLELQKQVSDAAAELRVRKQSAANILVAANPIIA
eukprot:Tamp_28587.p1 GENE.Tamp_28587~~Tamp_28587.p1  ORF type:complete len:168 (+),score=50.02 Tamp_28587:273-776(+)